MTERNMERIKLEWNMIEAYCNGVAAQVDKDLWISVCNTSHFRTSFSYYTSIDATYRGMLENCSFFFNNCSPEGMLGYIGFYQNQLGVAWKEIYVSSVNSYDPKKADLDARFKNNWWEDHLACLN